MWNDLTSNIYSFFIGGLLFLFTYHFIIYLQYRKKFYLYYSLYTLSLSLYLLEWNLGIGLSNPLLSFKPVLLYLSNGFYLFFINEILPFKDTDPKWYRIINTMGKICLITAGAIWSIYFMFEDWLKPQILFFNITTCLYIVFVFRVFYKLITLKTVYSKYILIGSSIYFLGAFTTFTISFFLSIKEFSQAYGFQLLSFTVVGIAIEALVFALIIGYKNKETESAKIMAQQNEQLQKQKVNNLLKEQEINIINAMVEGQENERNRLASDLHDNVGATLSAAKLQFDHLYKNRQSTAQSDKIFEKTAQLLEDAYKELRNFAHIKNNGVIAKYGLLPAVERLAKTTSLENLHIEVQHFGLDKKLNNEKEIALFRVIQELTNNIIKHADATEASISLTLRDDILNIIIEDNGKGFVQATTATYNPTGMGLNSIEKRIERMEGTLEIDSSLGKGTSIIIEIPV